jgi:hypothetical protein
VRDGGGGGGGEGGRQETDSRPRKGEERKLNRKGPGVSGNLQGPFEPISKV